MTVCQLQSGSIGPIHSYVEIPSLSGLALIGLPADFHGKARHVLGAVPSIDRPVLFSPKASVRCPSEQTANPPMALAAFLLANRGQARRGKVSSAELKVGLLLT